MNFTVELAFHLRTANHNYDSVPFHPLINLYTSKGMYLNSECGKFKARIRELDSVFFARRRLRKLGALSLSLSKDRCTISSKRKQPSQANSKLVQFKAVVSSNEANIAIVMENIAATGL